MSEAITTSESTPEFVPRGEDRRRVESMVAPDGVNYRQLADRRAGAAGALALLERPVTAAEVADLETLGQSVDAIFAPVEVEEAEQREISSPYRVDRKPEALIAELFDRVQSEKQRLGDNSRIMALRMDKGSAYGDVARYLEASEFKNAWYQGQDNKEFADTMAEEYAPYDDDSKFILLMDTEAFDDAGLPRLVGIARVAGGDEKLLKTVHDVPEIWPLSKQEILDDLKVCMNEEACEGIDVGNPEKTWDYSSMAVTEDYRGTDAYAILSHELYEWTVESGIHTVTTILVEDFFKLYKVRGVPFRAIAGAEPKVHMDAVSIPAIMHIPESELMATSDSNRVRDAYKQMVLGEDFEYCQLTV